MCIFFTIHLLTPIGVLLLISVATQTALINCDLARRTIQRRVCLVFFLDTVMKVGKFNNWKNS